MKLYLSLLIFVSILFFELFAAGFSLKAFAGHSNLVLLANLAQTLNFQGISAASVLAAAGREAESGLVTGPPWPLTRPESMNWQMCSSCRQAATNSLVQAGVLQALPETSWPPRQSAQSAVWAASQDDTRPLSAIYLTSNGCKQALLAMYHQ